MTELLQEHHILGLAIGFLTFIIIGLFHPLVIKGEYYLGLKAVWIFAAMGVLSGIVSYCVYDLFLSISMAVVSFSSFWSIKEVFDQKKRVEKGWFPSNPRRESKKSVKNHD